MMNGNLSRTPQYKIRYVIERFKYDSQENICKELHMGFKTFQHIKNAYGLKKARTSEKVIWDEKMLAYLTSHYKNTDNDTLAFHLDVSSRTVTRKAKELGLRKSKQFLHQRSVEAGNFAKHELKRRGLRYWNTPEQIRIFNEKGKPYRFKKKEDMEGNIKINIRGTLTSMAVGSEVTLEGIKRATLSNTCSVLKADYGYEFKTLKIANGTFKVIRNA